MPKKKMTQQEDFAKRVKGLLDEYTELHKKYQVNSQLVIRFPSKNLGMFEKLIMFLLVKRRGILDIEFQDIKK